MLVKLALGALLLGGAVWAFKRASGAFGVVGNAAAAVGDAVNAATLTSGWKTPGQFFESTSPADDELARVITGDLSSAPGSVQPLFGGQPANTVNGFSLDNLGAMP